MWFSTSVVAGNGRLYSWSHRESGARRVFFLALAVCLVSGCGGAAQVDDESPKMQTAKRVIAVAAASDLRFALDDVVMEFQKAHPDFDVRVTYGSSGNFFAQLSNQAPFDLFLSADVDYVRQLIAKEAALAGTDFVYGVGRIVVWVANASPLDFQRDGLLALADPGAGKVAIANPKHAPYGRAAQAALEKAGVYDQVRERLVLAENVAQAAQYVESGAAEVGIIAHSLVHSPAMQGKGRAWSVPVDLYPRLEQAGVITSWVKDRAASDALASFLKGDAGRKILARYGFGASAE